MAKLDQEQIKAALENLDGWSLPTGQAGGAGDWITKEFQFENFRDAMSFMLRASYEAEELNHHPNWSNVYNRVKVELQSHDESGVTERDVELASRFNKLS